MQCSSSCKLLRNWLYEGVANASMALAATELNKSSDVQLGPAMKRVKIDGSWQNHMVTVPKM